MENHHVACNCLSCIELVSEKEKERHILSAESSRRDFLRKASRVGLVLGLGGELVNPMAASALAYEDGVLKSKELFDNPAVKKGKVEVVTLLHTADIHAQLLTHDEFFIENGKPVYKKRG